MDINFKQDFNRLWQKYFNNSELPITFYYTDQEGHGETVKASSGFQCLIGQLVKVRQGNSLSFSQESLGCPGGKKWLGFLGEDTPMPNFEYFLSYGIPGKMEGERYKKSPEIVKELVKRLPEFKAPARFIVFKRWDKLEAPDNPEVVAFFAKPEVLAGLVTLANFDDADVNAVIAPWHSGCGSIVRNPYLEKNSAYPHGVIGMFDPSARPFVGSDELTFSVPMKKFIDMVRNMEKSFLTTHTWELIQKRIK